MVTKITYGVIRFRDKYNHVRIFQPFSHTQKNDLKKLKLFFFGRIEAGKTKQTQFMNKS